MTGNPLDPQDEVTAYVFSNGRPEGRRDLLGAIIERGLLLGLLTLMFLLIGSFAIYMWSQHEKSWDGTLLLAAIIVLGSGWNYLGLAMEVRIASEHLSFRRLVNFRSIKWNSISRVRVWSLRTMGITYVCVKGRSGVPLAFFALWIPWDCPERWENLLRLIEQVARRLPVKHTS